MPFVRKESLLATASAWLLAFCRLRRSTVESPLSSTAGTKRGGLDAGSRVSTIELGAAWCRPADAEALRLHDVVGVAWPCTVQARSIGGAQRTSCCQHPLVCSLALLVPCECVACKAQAAMLPCLQPAGGAWLHWADLCQAAKHCMSRPQAGVCITTLQLLQPFLHHVGRPEISSELLIASCSSRGGPRSADRGHTRARLPY